MALSNILKEPRREITETLAGLFIFVVLMWPDYKLGVLLRSLMVDSGGKPAFPVLFCMFLAALGSVTAFFFGCLVLSAIHAFGEIICEFLDGYGIRLRPKDRYHG